MVTSFRISVVIVEIASGHLESVVLCGALVKGPVIPILDEMACLVSDDPLTIRLTLVVRADIDYVRRMHVVAPWDVRVARVIDVDHAGHIYGDRRGASEQPGTC